MNEASKLSGFLTSLRKRMPGAVVIKHRDASMIGLPDFSITYRGHVVWCEAKLYACPKTYEPTPAWALAKAQVESPTQASTMTSLGRASASLYVIWVKKTCAYVVDPARPHEARTFKSDAKAIGLIAGLFDSWDSPPFPSLLSCL